MRVTYRPGTRVAATLLGGSDASEVPIPFLDEDEATLALDAVLPLLQAAELQPSQLRRIAVSSRTASGFGSTLAVALGVSAERVEEGAAILYGQTQHASPGEGPVLHVQSDAPRPGRLPPDGPGTGAFATARLSGPNLPTVSDRDLSGDPWPLDRDAVEKLGRWEGDSPKRATMGAFVPTPTWMRDAGARYRLEGARCAHGHVEFPFRPLCARCGSPTEAAPLPRPGVLETFTIVAKGAGPSEFEPLQSVQGEYAVGVASFGGARVPGLFVPTRLDALRIGSTVAPVFRRLYGQDGEWRYGVKFRLAGASK